MGNEKKPNRQERLERELQRYLDLMSMSDNQLRIYNANDRGVLEADPAYQKSEDFGVLLKLEERKGLKEDDYRRALFPTLYNGNSGQPNGNGKRPFYIPKGYAIAPDGSLCPVERMSEAQRAWNDTLSRHVH